MLSIKLLKLLEMSTNNFSIKDIIKQLIASKSSIKRYQVSCKATNKNARDNCVNVASIE